MAESNQQEETTMNTAEVNFEYNQKIDLQSLERGYILAAIRHHNGNKLRAAAALGVTVKTIYNKFKAWGGLDQYPEFQSIKGRPRKEK